MKNLILFLLLSSNSLSAQVTQEWVAKFKDTTTGTIYPASISSDNLGNIYVSGRCNAFNGSRYITFKYSNSGNLQWYRIYQSPYFFTIGDADVVLKNVVDRDNNIYVTGYSHNDSSNTDIVTIKYNSLGDSIWVKRYNGLANGDDYPRDMVIDKYSNVYITAISRGTSSEDYLTLKYDSTGNLLWNAVLTNGDVPNAMALDSSGNVYVTGESSSFFTDYLTVKYNNSGVLQWVRTHGSERDAEGTSIASDITGNVYVTGFITFFDGSSDYSTLKYDSSGNLLWSKDFERFYAKSPYKILIDSSSNCFIVGSSAILKYDSSGRILWSDTSSFFESIYSTLDRKGNLYVCRTTFITKVSNYFTTMKYGVNGNILWNRNYGGGENHIYGPAGISLDQNNNVFTTGFEFLNGTPNSDTLITIKYSQITGIGNYNNHISEYNLYQNYPNPFNPISIIKYQIAKSSFVDLKIYDVLGKEIATLVNKKQNAGVYEVEFNGEKLPSGIYFYSLYIDNNLINTRKMLLVK